MVLPENKACSFGILDSPNFDKVELFLYLNYLKSKICEIYSFLVTSPPIQTIIFLVLKSMQAL